MASQAKGGGGGGVMSNLSLPVLLLRSWSEVTLFHQKRTPLNGFLGKSSLVLVVPHIYKHAMESNGPVCVKEHSTWGWIKWRGGWNNPFENQWKRFEILLVLRSSLFTACALIYSSKRWVTFMCITFFVTWGWPCVMICVQFFPLIHVRPSCTPAAFHDWHGSHCDHMR